MIRPVYAASPGVCDLLGGFLESLDFAADDSGLSPEMLLRAQLTARADGTASGRSSMCVYARSCVSEDRDAVISVVQRAHQLMLQLKKSSCTLDIVLLLDELLAETGEKRDWECKETRKTVSRLGVEIGKVASCVGVRVWLLDGVASKGQVYSLDDVRDLLEVCSPQDLASVLPIGVHNFHSFGARSVVFPRTRILEHISATFACEVVAGSAVLRRIAVPYSTASLKCAEFMREVVLPGLEGLDKGDEGGRVVAEPRMPAVEAAKPLQMTLAELDGAVDALRLELERARAQIDRNYADAVGTVIAAMDSAVDGFLDQSDTGVGMAHAFLDILEIGESGSVTDVQLSGSRQSTLREVFAPALKYLDAVTDFDSAKRDQLLRTDQDLWSNREWLTKLEHDLASAQCLDEGDNVRAAVDVEVLQNQIEAASATIAALTEQSTTLWREVRAQDHRVSGPGIRALADAVLSRAQQRIDETREAAASAEKAADEATERLHEAQGILRSAFLKTAQRGALLLLAMLAVGVAGLVALPIVVGAVPIVGKPLFGFIGTVAAAAWVKWWGIATLVIVLGLLIRGAMVYVREARRITGLESARDQAVAAYLRAIRTCWNASVAEVEDQIDVRKYSHTLKIESAMTKHCAALRTRLLGFEGAIAGLLESLRAEVDSFTLASSVSEFLVIDTAYAHSLVKENRGSITNAATKFFAAHPISVYLRDYGETESLDRLTSDLRDVARGEFKSLIGERTVLDVLASNPEMRREVQALVTDIPVLSPLDGEGWKPSILILGSDADAIRADFSRITPTPSISVIDDPERLVFARVVHGIEFVAPAPRGDTSDQTT